MTDADLDREFLYDRLDDIRRAIDSPLIPPQRQQTIRDACRAIECELDPTMTERIEICDDCGRHGLPEELERHVCGL